MLFVIFVLLLFIRKNIYGLIGLNDWKNVPNPILLVIYGVCSFTFHSKQYLKLQLKKRLEQHMHIDCDVCSFNFHSEEYLWLYCDSLVLILILISIKTRSDHIFDLNHHHPTSKKHKKSYSIKCKNSMNFIIHIKTKCNA